MSAYGRIVYGKQVRDAMEATCRQWLPWYLAEMDRLTERPPGSLPDCRSWQPAVRSPSSYVEDQLPAGIVVAPGIVDEPPRRGGGVYDAVWSVGVGVVVKGQDRDNTLELAELYAAAIRALVVQHRSLGGFASATDWVGERYDELESTRIRTLGLSVVQFYVGVEGVVDEGMGLAVPPVGPGPEPEPPTTPVPEPATVTSVEVVTYPLGDES